jgi:hypothetical protein
MHKQRVVMIVLAAIGAIGTFLPWVTIPIIGSINGTAGDGWITMSLFAATILVTVFIDNRVRPLNTQYGLLASAPALLAALVGAYKVHDFYSIIGAMAADNPLVKGFASTVNVGPGLFAIIAMGLGVPGVSLAMAREALPAESAHGVAPKPLPKSVLVTAAVAMCLVIAAFVTFKVLDNPKSLEITENNRAEVAAKVKEATSISAEDKKVFAAAMARSELPLALFGSSKNEAKSWDGKTVSQIIDEQRQWTAKKKADDEREAALAAEAKAKQERLDAELESAVALTVVKKELVAADEFGISKRVELRCAYRNTSSKDIRAFQGKLEFKDLFGDSIVSTTIKISDPVAAGEKGTWNGSMHFNEFIEGQKKLANTTLSDMKVAWSPRTVIFADGTTLEDSSDNQE